MASVDTKREKRILVAEIMQLRKALTSGSLSKRERALAAAREIKLTMKLAS